MRTRFDPSLLIVAAIAACYCAAAFSQTTDSPNETEQVPPDSTPPLTGVPDPKNEARPHANPRARQNDTNATSQSRAATELERCAALTGVPRAECERRDSPASTDDLPAGVTTGDRIRQAERERRTEEVRPASPTTEAGDTARKPPVGTRESPNSAREPDTSHPARDAPDNVDSLDRPRQ
jgi:hypothetical protein